MVTMRLEVWFAALTLLLLGGCGSDGGGGDEGAGGPRPASGDTLWLINRGVPFLQGIDTGTGDVEVDVEVAEGDTRIFSLAVEDDRVWVGRDDGTIVVVDAEASAIEKTLALADPETTIEHLALGDGSAYVATGSSFEPLLTRIDASDFSTRATAPVIVTSNRFDAVLYGRSNVFVLSGNAFGVKKLDPATLASVGSVGLGSDPSNPDALSDDTYGTGHMARAGSILWVVDQASHRLLRVGEESLDASVVDDLSDLLEPEGYTEFTSNGTSTFLLLSERAEIVRFDGTTGARRRTYVLPEGASTMAASEKKLYVATTSSSRRIVELDIESGEVTQTLEPNGVNVDLLAVE